MINLTIEFTGLSSLIAETPETSLSIEDNETYRDVVRALAERFPGLVGILIAPDKNEFLSSNMLVIDGDLVNPVMILDNKPKDGERLHLMSVITGG